MERRYYRQYENFDTVVPRIDDFPVLDAHTAASTKCDDNSAILSGIKADDIILLGILILLLLEDEKDITAILGIAFLFLAEYIF